MEAMHEILRDFPYGIYIVGVRGREAGEVSGLVVSWLAQCSFEPPLIMLAVRHDSRSFALIEESQVFSVNIVGPDQRNWRGIL